MYRYQHIQCRCDIIPRQGPELLDEIAVSKFSLANITFVLPVNSKVVTLSSFPEYLYPRNMYITHETKYAFVYAPERLFKEV